MEHVVKVGVNIVHMAIKRINNITLIFLASLLGLVSACQSGNTNTDALIDGLAWEEDRAQFANNFAIQHAGNRHQRLLIFSSSDRSDTVSRFYKGNIKCNGHYVCIDSIHGFASLSSTYVGFLDALNASNQIQFVDQTDYIYSKRVRKSIEDKTIQECGSGEQLNFELLLGVKPLVLAYQIEGGDATILNRLKKLNIPHLNCTDFKEASPLGRAEWLKVFGLLSGKKKEADVLFNEVLEHYNETKYFCAQIKEKPTVFSGSVFGGVWNVSGGKSFLAHLIQDAGGDYIFAQDTERLNVVLPFEKVYQRSKNAEVWLHPSYYHTLKEITTEDERYALFEAYQNKRVYNNNKMENGLGGNAYWEMGVLRPDLILNDIAQCLHPALYQGNTTIFYKPVD